MSPCLIGDGLTLCRPPASQPLTRWSETIDLGSARKVFHHRTHVIRVLDLAGGLAFDMDEAVRAKMDKNRARPYRHGGKRL